MRNLVLGITLMIFLFQCTSTQDHDNPVNNDSSERPPQQQKKELSNLPHSGQIPDFLDLTENSSEAGKIFLQRVKHSDSSGPYILKQFFSDSLSFDLLFYPKNGDKNAVDFDAIKKAKSNGYKDFICFAFVFPMKNPDSMNDYHADNTTYPTLVKAYAKKLSTWDFISQSKINSLSEMSEYMIKAIYMTTKASK